MPNIYDNISQTFLPALQQALSMSYRADFCVGFFNLRGWQNLDEYIGQFTGGPGQCCRLLIGMQSLPQDDIKLALQSELAMGATTSISDPFSSANATPLAKTASSLVPPGMVDKGTIIRLKNKILYQFREQLSLGMPSNVVEAKLRILARQLQSQKLYVKVFLRYKLHAKLYLLWLHRSPIAPEVGYLGSSNLTLAGLQHQGELNIDILDKQAFQILSQWFEDRWQDSCCLDISQDLIEMIENSWAGEKQQSPYHIYLKMVYHLCQEARAGFLQDSRIPPKIDQELFQYQKEAVYLAMQHLILRNGVLIGDVVGLGKTWVATALIKMLENDYGYSTLIICPPHLVQMWDNYKRKYGLSAEVLSLGVVSKKLAKDSEGNFQDMNFLRYRVVVIDESHNLRNREGSRYKVIFEYIQSNHCKVILLSATPYNKEYKDLGSQLRLFISPDQDLGIRPEAFIQKMIVSSILREEEKRKKSQASSPTDTTESTSLDTETKVREQAASSPQQTASMARVIEKYFADQQVMPHTLAAFELSEEPEDWQELMRLYLIRRTRSFIKKHYAKMEPTESQSTGKADMAEKHTARPRYFLHFPNGTRSYFPDRIPKTIPFPISHQNPNDQYAQLYTQDVVEKIDHLCLPRYGLGSYRNVLPEHAVNEEEQKILANLSRAGQRLKGFCRTNLFKRLESSGQAFLQSLDSHILRNYVFLYAIQHDLPLPIGMQDSSLLYAETSDLDIEEINDDNEENDSCEPSSPHKASSSWTANLATPDEWERQAAAIYERYKNEYKNRFHWIRPCLFSTPFQGDLQKDLQTDVQALMAIRQKCPEWKPQQDSKLQALCHLLQQIHPKEKVLIFSQFADTVQYLETQFQARGISSFAAVTGAYFDPTAIAMRFSPKCNGQENREDELRILITTDVLSEGQNLQDCYIVVNYDLPWAIIRLTQRVGRVDRIGQESQKILCYSFLPADGVEHIIGLRKKITHRLTQNRNVLGSDELFFEDQMTEQQVLDLYHEKPGQLDDDEDEEVDLATYAYQIWNEATDQYPDLIKIIPALPPVVYSTKPFSPTQRKPEGVLAFIRTVQGNETLAWVSADGKNIVTQSPYAILQAAECTPDTSVLPRLVNHHDLVAVAVKQTAVSTIQLEGKLGSSHGPRARLYEKLRLLVEKKQQDFFELSENDRRMLKQVIDCLYHHPLCDAAAKKFSNLLRYPIPVQELVKIVLEMFQTDTLCSKKNGVEDDNPSSGPQIICSMGLKASN